jgi:hypothetical protein
MLATVFKDPWGSPYALQLTEGAISIRSAGADRRWGTEDDIVETLPLHGVPSR